MKNSYFKWNTVRSENTVEIEQVIAQETPVENDVVEGLTSIIIPAHISTFPLFHMTGNCIGSIREHTNKEENPYEIVLVLNGKPVIEFNDLAQTYCDKVVQLEENEGFAKAVNRGIRVSNGEYVALVNNDVQVFDHWLEYLQRCLNDIDLVMATPMYGRPWARAVEARELSSKCEGMLVKETFSDFKDFSCVLTKRDVFDKVGLFDEQFFMYGEDTDLMRRMDKEGLTYASTKMVNVMHVVGATSVTVPQATVSLEESREKLRQKWGE